MAYVIDKKIMNKPREKYWISYIKQRIRNNKNFLGFISGPTGSGKSYSSLRICEDIDPEFSIEKVVFSGVELMTLINSGKLKRGSCISFEEVGVEMSSKNWASVTNKMLNYLMQTFRHRGFILIMNSPYMDFVDNSMRKLFHAELITTKIDFKAKEVLLKPQLLQYNSKYQKFYWKRLKVIKPEGKVPISIWRVAIPSEKLRLSYENKKSQYTDRLNNRILEELQAVENKNKHKKELTDIQQEVLDLLKQGLNVDQISSAKNRSKTAVNVTIRLIKGKGYEFKPVYDDISHRKVVRYEVIAPNTHV